jgi:hypothetical protein
MRSLVLCLAATLLAVPFAPASGAELRITTPDELLRLGGAQVLLEGTIEIGDYDKLLKRIDEDCSNHTCIDAIYLASPGRQCYRSNEGWSPGAKATFGNTCPK